MKVLFWVQHLLGIGHARRAALITRALVAEGARVTVVQGGFPVPNVRFDPAAVVALPPARAADAQFSEIVDDAGRAIDSAWKGARADLLVGVLDAFEPDVVVTETFPFGRRAFRTEVEALLQAATAKSPRPLIAASIRDILVRHNDARKDAWIVDTARRWYDLVLVHGDPAVLPLEASFPPAAEIADLIRYTGYVTPPRIQDEGGGDDGSGEVIVSVGGGAVGAGVLTTALAARPLTSLATAPWRLLLGPDLPEAAADALRQAGGPGVIVEPARPDFPALLRRCRLSVSQAGYNTVMDVLAAGCRSVLVPFAAGKETEQTDRARLLAERGLATMVAESDLTPAVLAGAIDRAAAGPMATVALDAAGAEKTARLLVAAATDRTGRNPRVSACAPSDV